MSRLNNNLYDYFLVIYGKSSASILTHFSYTYVGLACWQQIQTKRKTTTLMMYVFHFGD